MEGLAMSSTMRGADIVARSLERLGCRRIFTLSGNHIMSLFDATLETKIKLVHVRHEAAAVHMADGWGRLTGEPGVAMVTGGPGHANAIGALFAALASESPMVLLSGHAATRELGRGGFQELRQAQIAEPVTKASWTAKSTSGLAEDIGNAMRIARQGRPGPVHVSLPSDLLDEIVDVGSIAWPDGHDDQAHRTLLRLMRTACSRRLHPLPGLSSSLRRSFLTSADARFSGSWRRSRTRPRLS
jgi:acetolactate synthase I/II/III large subunit